MTDERAGPTPLVSVCVATYRRPEGLTRLLDSLERQKLAQRVTVEIVVVDNDPPSAEQLVTTHAARSRYVVRYLEQPEPNISLTRNTGVNAARGELVWFVDDDEEAEPGCLQHLLDALEDHSADAVFGPVVPSFEAATPDWLKPLFERPIHPTGNTSTAYRTGNTLVRTAVLRSLEGPFDPAFGLSGGEDAMLFRQLEAAGCHLIDSSSAIVSEAVPQDRADWTWLRTRMRRQGRNWARLTRALDGGRVGLASLTMAGKAVAQVAAFAVAAGWRWSDRTKRSRHLLRVWTNIGKLEGLFHREN